MFRVRVEGVPRIRAPIFQSVNLTSGILSTSRNHAPLRQSLPSLVALIPCPGLASPGLKPRQKIKILQISTQYPKPKILKPFLYSLFVYICPFNPYRSWDRFRGFRKGWRPLGFIAFHVLLGLPCCPSSASSPSRGTRSAHGGHDRYWTLLEDYA